MEWSSGYGSTWLNVEGDTIANLSPGTYWIRYSATDTHKASPHVELTIVVYTQPLHVTGVSLNQIAVQMYTNHGNGKPGNVLEPASVVSRAEVSVMIVRFIAWRSN
ncbi:hypothetical protein [Paenibacillus vulneris]